MILSYRRRAVVTPSPSQHTWPRCFAEQVSSTAAPNTGHRRLSKLLAEPRFAVSFPRVLQHLQHKRQISGTIYICFSWLRRPYRSTVKKQLRQPAQAWGHNRSPFPSDCSAAPAAPGPAVSQPAPHTSTQHGIHHKTIIVTKQRHLTHLFHTNDSPQWRFSCHFQPRPRLPARGPTLQPEQLLTCYADASWCLGFYVHSVSFSSSRPVCQNPQQALPGQRLLYMATGAPGGCGPCPVPPAGPDGLLSGPSCAACDWLNVLLFPAACCKVSKKLDFVVFNWCPFLVFRWIDAVFHKSEGKYRDWMPAFYIRVKYFSKVLYWVSASFSRPFVGVRSCCTPTQPRTPRLLSRTENWADESKWCLEIVYLSEFSYSVEKEFLRLWNG